MRTFINQLKENETVREIYQLTEILLRENKNGVLYLQFTMTDRTGTLDGRFWNATEEIFQKIKEYDYVLCEGTVQRFQRNLQFMARKLTGISASQVNPEDFCRFKTLDTVMLIKRLREMLRTLQSPDLLNLADCFMADEEFLQRFSQTYSGIRLHHAYPGGLLEHTVTMMEVVLAIAPFYGSTLDRDLLLMGAFLHDIGKMEELSLMESQPAYTDSGQLLGHPYLGIEMLQEKIEETEKLVGESFDPETAMLLKHMILSHHGTLENGSTKLPMTLEAMVLYYIDSMDAKISEFSKYIADDPNSGSGWTNFIPPIARKLYKGKKK
ncbi:MAG: HD domain-containing protein [Thermoguttaceae bacterium]|nr:HD domain-containing protein [Thermoguttaceae bacterium]